VVACREDRAQAVDACGAKASVKQTQGDKIMRDISRREPMETMLLAGAGFLHAERQVGGGQSPLHERAESGRSTEGMSAVIAGPGLAIIHSSLILLKSATISVSRQSSLTSFSISFGLTEVGSSSMRFRQVRNRDGAHNSSSKDKKMGIVRPS